MQLQNNMFSIISSSVKGDDFEYNICLNENCNIYRAHFPESPITPGVCVLQIAKELFEERMKCLVEIIKIKNVKFLQVMIPTPNAEYTYHFSNITLDGNTYKMKVVVVNGDITYSKLSFTCQKS